MFFLGRDHFKELHEQTDLPQFLLFVWREDKGVLQGGLYGSIWGQWVHRHSGEGWTFHYYDPLS
jgi:hypothetical protein